MTFDDPLPQRRKMATALVLSLAAHLALVLLWRAATGVPPPVEHAESSVTVQLLTLPPLQKLVKRVLPPKQETHRDDSVKPSAQRPAAVDAPAASNPATPQPPVAREQSAAPDPAPATPDADELMSSLRKDIGRIDRDLRKERPNLPGASMGSRESKLSKSIAAAGKSTGGWLGAPKIEPIELGDGQGRRTYKVTMPDGRHYCVVYESVGRRDGYDPSQMRSFSQPKTMSCPGDLSF
jgi:hypothetical protein